MYCQRQRATLRASRDESGLPAKRAVLISVFEDDVGGGVFSYGQHPLATASLLDGSTVDLLALCGRERCK